MFAIEEINQNQRLLPNHTLGFRFMDSCFSEVVALQDTLLLLSGRNRTLPNYKCEAQLILAGIIGELYSSVSEVMARILGVYRIPQVSISALHPMLSDKHQFPSFLRTFPAATLLPQAIAQMLHYFNWTWVGILYSNADITSLKSQKIRQQVVENGGCVAFLEKIDDRYPSVRLVKVAEVILQSSATVIVCLCYEMHLKPILELLSFRDITAKVWVFSSSFTINPHVFTRESWRLLNGSLVFIGSTNDIPHFSNFLYHVLQYLWDVRFTTESKEEVYFDENGDVPAVFDILNIQIHPDDNTQVIKVGRYDARESPGDEIILNITAIVWNQNNQTPSSDCSESCPVGYRKSTRLGQPSCCFDCIPCSAGEIANETDTTECRKCPEDQWPSENREKCIPKVIEFLSYHEPLGATLVAVAVILSLATILILFIFYLFQDTPIVRANNRGLSYLLLCSLTLCFLCSLTFVGFPMKLTCMIRQPAFGLIFTISVSCILAKTVTVIIAFKAVNPHNQLRKWVGPKIPNFIIIFCSLIQLVICTIWISSHPSFPEYNTRSESGKIIVECNDGLTILFYCMLGYMGFLAIISFIVAFLARTLPDSFNEAKFITFSMLVFVSVWLSFIPAYLSTQGKYMVAVEVFTILSSGAGLLFLIFLPKCYIILLQPEMNTKENLRGKSTTGK
ncbi:vomeronasal type-2 receptor 26-like [Rhinatrema bivittatum]|uniref:vomeronasal type-2 receptor 26-like n=1 Tax=Rhinatrema bivittatum TaxID=194408 RepID=UPI00112D98E5|nr:vomeronasal type-2 receptor 26-like [Rhinatrema bivittatum]